MSRDIIIYPNRSLTGSTDQPYISFSGLSAGTINLVVEDDGSITFDGDTGSLFGISDNKEGLLHSVNDVSGLPIFQVYDNDWLSMGKWDEPTLIISGETFNIIGGSNHTMLSGVTGTTIMGGAGITADTSDMVYVPNFNIETLGTGTSINNLGIDALGNVVTGTAGGGSGSVGGTGTTNTITKWQSSTGLTDSNIIDDGVDVTINSNLKITGTTYSPTYSGDGVTAVYYGDGSNLTGVGGVDATSATTTVVDFTGQTIYYDSVSPSSATVFTNDLTGAKLGLLQKIYSNAVTEPTKPVGWVLMGDGIYFTSILNIIYAEWVGGSRVEYWYVQEQ